MMDNVKETGAMSPWERWYNEGYADGYSKGKEKGYHDRQDKDYMAGAEALRTAILKVLRPYNYELPLEFLNGVYSHNVDLFIKNNTAKDIIRLVDEEEKKHKEIKVGDEVIVSGKTGVVTDVEFTDLSDELFVYVLYEDGQTKGELGRKLEKTGCRIPEIEKVLKALREGD